MHQVQIILDLKSAAGQFLGRLNTNCGLLSAESQFSRPAVGLMVFRLKIGLFSAYLCVFVVIIVDSQP